MMRLSAGGPAELSVAASRKVDGILQSLDAPLALLPSAEKVGVRSLVRYRSKLTRSAIRVLRTVNLDLRTVFQPPQASFFLRQAHRLSRGGPASANRARLELTAREAGLLDALGPSAFSDSFLSY